MTISIVKPPGGSPGGYYEQQGCESLLPSSMSLHDNQCIGCQCFYEGRRRGREICLPCSIFNRFHAIPPGEACQPAEQVSEGVPGHPERGATSPERGRHHSTYGGAPPLLVSYNQISHTNNTAHAIQPRGILA